MMIFRLLFYNDVELVYAIENHFTRIVFSRAVDCFAAWVMILITERLLMYSFVFGEDVRSLFFVIFISLAF